MAPHGIQAAVNGHVSNSDLTSVLLVLLLLVALAQLLGYLFMKLRQPKVVGEILAGVVLGPAVVGRSSSASWILEATQRQANVLTFVYWLGLLLLMFLSGAEIQQLFTREERREVGWLAIVGTGIPFVLALIAGPWLVGPNLAGPNGNGISLIIILAVGVAVTSVPVVSKIFADLKILHTRFARLVLGVAVLEDIVLWLALAVATTLAGKTVLNPRQMSYHLLTTVGFFALGLTIVPRIVKRLNKSNFNVFAKQSPVAYAIAVLLTYCVVAGALDVSLVFAAFLAGFAVVHKKRRLFAEALDAIGKVSFAFFIPVYFAIVGLKLDLIRGLSWWMIGTFILGSCAVKILSVSAAGRFAGFRGLDLINLAITTNARGGPGIVLASVAFDAGIISPKFYTTLVIAAVLTSQVAGAWLDYVLSKGWPLLTPVTPSDSTVRATAESPLAP
ncbi:MAG TPA: cation:proton antiporter [Candidatus Sulfotelmatobacter sp.]|nr:cation:proton antiporter [Candidatus Sulfotelmatobacter sp.]